MFSIAEDVFEGQGETTGRPLELTCYRRNLFQISGSVALSRSLARVVLDQGRNAQITELYASLSATESIEGKHTDIISVPWKTGIANVASLEDKSGTAPAPISIDLSSNQESDPIQVTIPIAWRRLQFKYATANNGRRKGLQQHYKIQIALMAKVEGEDQPIKIAEIHSNNIVVRGRSPKNFDSSKDVPLSERKQSDPMNRRGQQGQAASISSGTPQQQQQWGIEPAITQASGKYYAQQSFQVCLHVFLNSLIPLGYEFLRYHEELRLLKRNFRQNIYLHPPDTYRQYLLMATHVTDTRTFSRSSHTLTTYRKSWSTTRQTLSFYVYPVKATPNINSKHTKHTKTSYSA